MNTCKMDGLSTTMELFGVLVESCSYVLFWFVEFQQCHKPSFQFPFLYLYFYAYNSIYNCRYIVYKDEHFLMYFAQDLVSV
jgi:hypothetical protein